MYIDIFDSVNCLKMQRFYSCIVDITRTSLKWYPVNSPPIIYMINTINLKESSPPTFHRGTFIAGKLFPVIKPVVPNEN